MLAAVLSLLLLLSGVAVAQASVGEATLYGTPTAGPFSGADAAGSEGDVWVIAGHSGTEAVLERFASDGTESKEPVNVTIPSGDEPVSIAPGPEGTMWLALAGTEPEVGKASAAGGPLTDVEMLPAGNEPTQIATDAAGDLYVAETGEHPQIGKRLEPAGTLTEFAPLAGDEPIALALTGTGAVWVSDMTLPGVRLVAEGKEVFSETLTEAPRSLAVQGESVWFGVGGLAPAIDRLTEAHVPLESVTAGLETGDEPRAISTAPDGNVWFAVEHAGAPALGRITPSGAIRKFPLAGVHSFGPTIAVGADKRIWIAVEGETNEWQLAAVTVLEPEKEPPTEPTPLPPKVPVAAGSLTVGPAVVFAAAHATCSGVVFSEGTVTTQWLLDGSPIAGATSATYTPPRAEDGHLLSCSETATGTNGRSTTVTSPAQTVHEQPAQPSWPIGPAAQHCSSPVCMQDGSGMGETVQSYREGSAWWASRQVRCVSAPWTSIVGDSAQPAVRAFAEAHSITIAIQRMTASGPVTVAAQTLEGLGAARDELDGSVAGDPFAGDVAIPLGAHLFAPRELWSTAFAAATGRADWLAPGGGLVLYDVSSAAGAARSLQLIYTLSAADRGAHLRCAVTASDGPAGASTISSYFTREAPISTSAACTPRRVSVGGPQPTVLLDGNTACLAAVAGPPAPATGLQALAVRSGRLAVAVVCGVHGGCGGRLALAGAHGTIAQSGPLHVHPGTDRLIRLALSASQARRVARAGRAGLPVRLTLGTAGTLAQVSLIAVR